MTLSRRNINYLRVFMRSKEKEKEEKINITIYSLAVRSFFRWSGVEERGAVIFNHYRSPLVISERNIPEP